MEPERLPATQSIIQSVEICNELSVNEFVNLQIPTVVDEIDKMIKGSMTKVTGKLFEMFADEGKLELVPNQDIEHINPHDLKYQLKSEDL